MDYDHSLDVRIGKSGNRKGDVARSLCLSTVFFVLANTGLSVGDLRNGQKNN